MRKLRTFAPIAFSLFFLFFAACTGSSVSDSTSSGSGSFHEPSTISTTQAPKGNGDFYLGGEDPTERAIPGKSMVCSGEDRNYAWRIDIALTEALVNKTKKPEDGVNKSVEREKPIYFASTIESKPRAIILFGEHFILLDLKEFSDSVTGAILHGVLQSQSFSGEIAFKCSMN